MPESAPIDPTPLTIKTYDAIAGEYGLAFPEELVKWKQASMRLFVGHLPSKSILVPGCGTGRDSRYLASLGYTVTSFDLSEGMLKQARASDPEGTYRQLDIRDVDRIGGQFGGIWASSCLYHFTSDDLIAILDAFAALLEPGGLLYLSMKLGAGSGFEQVPRADYPGGEKAVSTLKGPRFYSYYSVRELADMLSRYEITLSRKIEVAPDAQEFFARLKNQP